MEKKFKMNQGMIENPINCIEVKYFAGKTSTKKTSPKYLREKNI
jgi:hypothetical protein